MGTQVCSEYLIDMAKFGNRERGSKPPTEGGCWYCHNDDGEMVFSMEFDTYLHLECIQTAAKAFADDPEVKIFKDEFRELLNA